MKIQCDACDKYEASVFCVADEAPLCTACDHRIHHANKLAIKHQRFSLLHPSAKQPLICDICQDKRAFLFCQEDRAILCRECDMVIHKANEYTQKHSRFLLTGVKLSPISSLHDAAAAAATVAGGPDLQSRKSTNNEPIFKINHPNVEGDDHPRYINASAAAGNSSTIGQMTSGVGGGGGGSGGGGYNINNVPTISSSRSISEYLETLPGWHVEDLLDPSSPSSFGFCKSTASTLAAGNEITMPLWDGDQDDIESNLSYFSSYSTAMGASWVPQSAAAAPPFLHYPTTQQIDQIHHDPQSFSKSDTVQQITSCIKGSINNKDLSKVRKWSDDNCFAVPQISYPPPSSIAPSKRYRTLL